MSAGLPIAHFERKYEIHPDGRVWNKGKNKWQATTANPNGYVKVTLTMNGKREQLLVHRLVALHYLPNPYGHPQVNHRDGNKENNDLTNLEWMDRSENIQHSLETGLRAGFMSMGEKRTLMDRVFAGEIVSEIAIQIGRHPVVLSKMLRLHAEKIGLKDEWTHMMKQRRKDAAVRNLQKIKPRNSSGS